MKNWLDLIKLISHPISDLIIIKLNYNPIIFVVYVPKVLYASAMWYVYNPFFINYLSMFCLSINFTFSPTWEEVT